jgi:hypothetical protein
LTEFTSPYILNTQRGWHTSEGADDDDDDDDNNNNNNNNVQN